MLIESFKHKFEKVSQYTPFWYFCGEAFVSCSLQKDGGQKYTIEVEGLSTYINFFLRGKAWKR